MVAAQMTKRLCTASIFVLLLAACWAMTWRAPYYVWWSDGESEQWMRQHGHHLWAGAWFCLNVLVPLAFAVIFVGGVRAGWNVSAWMCGKLRGEKP